MKPEELESWFETEKNNLEQEYITRLKAGESSEQIREDFDRKMFATIQKYQQENIAAIKPEGVKKAQAEWNKKVIDKIYHFMDNITEKFKE